MSEVFFAPARVKEVRWQETLPSKLEALMERLNIAEMVKGQTVAIKLHLGGNVGYTTIHPLFVRKVVQYVKAAGGRPFLCDGPGAAYTAGERGYSTETVGCPSYPVAGIMDTYSRPVPVDFMGIKEIHVAGEIADVPVMINLSHAKGHPVCGYGGAIKNLAMGAVTGITRRDLHALFGAVSFWDKEACEFCNVCVENCRMSAISFDEEQNLKVNFLTCNFCGRCVAICPTNAMAVSEENYMGFQRGMALATKSVLDTFQPGKVAHINIATQITPFCDCFGMSTPPMIRDVGMFASRDIVAIDQATLDLIGKEELIPGTLPDSLIYSDKQAHLFERVHGIDPYVMVKQAETLEMGSTGYDLTEI